MYCPKCNSAIPDNAAFCSICGTQFQNMMYQGMQSNIAPQSMPQNMMSQGMMSQDMSQGMMPQGMSQGMMPQGMSPIQIVPTGKKIRYGCTSCKAVTDVMADYSCPSCGMPTPPGGYIKLYRMGSPLGIATGFGIYIDGQPTGYVGNKQTCWIRVPYGTHQIHIAVALNRDCEDVVVTLTPDHPLEGLKVYLKAGFWTNKFMLVPANPAEIPD